MPQDTVCLAEWIDSKIGKRREFRSNRALAEHIGVSEGTVRNLRRKCDGSGNYTPTLDTLRKIAEAFPAVSLVELQRMAGLPVPPAEGSRDEQEERLMNAAARLTPEHQKLVMSLVYTLLAEQRNTDAEGED